MPALADLDLRDSTVLKGLAISFIVLHNFFHAVNPARQNEFHFHPGGFAIFLGQVQHAPTAIQAFFSYFGHLGVVVFIFLSAYGLAKSHWDDSASWTQFMVRRIVKLYPIFGLIVLPWTFIISFQVPREQFLHTILPEIVLLMAGISPLLPGLDLPPVGPWWFIPFIVEFYAVFYLLRWVTRKFGWSGLVVMAALGLGVSALADPWLARWKINLLATPLGRMPLLCLGIAAARYPFRIRGPIVLLAAAVLVLGCSQALLWPFLDLAALLLILAAYMGMRVGLRNRWLIEHIGRYSIIIFLINAMIRDQFLSYATTPLLQLEFGAITAILSFVIAAAIHELLIPSGIKIRPPLTT